MRAHRRPREAEEEESAYVSMTDMTVGFLFIVMLMMAYFATQFGATDSANVRTAELERMLSQLSVRNPLEAYLSQAAAERRRVLERLRDSLSVPPGLLVEVTDEGDALRFTGEGMFRSDSAELSSDARRVVAELGTLLDEAIGCYTFGEISRPPNCPDAQFAIETILIEGHTDTVGREENNRPLSTNRANTAFRVMTEAAPALRNRANFRGQPVLGLAGYGEMRLAVPTADNVNEPANRRIDIRILMQTPANVAEIETIRQRLREGR